ncbi:hypothetical protein CVV38_03900 [Candidatus Peregrinibacteria bacterium HGW-Peregrinibacteria-1]|nr:MAG: hypothetical protein CVV38_03900 [Candidatus Peregrinibacteria bacterium HGW-Peregrinibacteria-1]
MSVFFDYLVTGVVFFLVFSVLVLVHEFGHFYAAKKAGIKVEEFGFGLPPRLFGKKKGETIYSVNWIPFGGFVRMLGEDSKDPKMLDHGRSFVSKPAWKRMIVVIAGVVMNFALAWVLLTGAYIFGVEPFWTSREEILQAVDDEAIKIREGVVVSRDIEIDSRFVLREGDVLVGVEGGGSILDLLTSGNDSESEVSVQIVRGDEVLVEKFAAGVFTEWREEGVFYDFLTTPRTKIFVGNEDLQKDDLVLRVDGKQVYSPMEFVDAMRGSDQELVDVSVYRAGIVENVQIEAGGGSSDFRGVVIADVVSGGAADMAGLKEGDLVVAFQGREVEDLDVLMSEIDLVKSESAGDILYDYVIDRGGEQKMYSITPNETGLIGIYFANLLEVEGVSFYDSAMLSSIVHVEKDKYPFWSAPWKGLTETVRLSKLTVQGLGSALVGFIRGDDVSDVVGGPVRIAQLTGDAVDAGLMTIIKLIAILSISLAVLNILPVPALDGGRLLFILVEMVIRRRINQKFETYVHLLGYLLLLGLIVLITYSDFVRLFAD